MEGGTNGRGAGWEKKTLKESGTQGQLRSRNQRERSTCRDDRQGKGGWGAAGGGRRGEGGGGGLI